MTLNTYQYDKAVTPPEATCLLKAGNGIFRYERTPLWTATVLEETARKDYRVPRCKEQYTLTITNKVPASSVYEVQSFFARTRRECGAEALVLIFYNPTTDEYVFDAPPQRNSPGGVTGDPIPAPDGCLEVGSIHSHPGSAFHSSTDIKDEQKADGIHLVFGYVDRFVPEVVATLSVHGTRFTIDPADVIELPWDYNGAWSKQLHGGLR